MPYRAGLHPENQGQGTNGLEGKPGDGTQLVKYPSFNTKDLSLIPALT